MNGVLLCEDSGVDVEPDQSDASWADDLESPVYLVSPADHVEPGQDGIRGVPLTQTIRSMRVFEESFVADLAAALQVPAARIEITSMNQLGRTFFAINYAVTPDRLSDRSPTQLAGQVEAMRLAGTLHDQSWLFSHIQRRVVAPPPPGSAPAPAPGSAPPPTPLDVAEPQSVLECT
eukprot:COSAG02_NODE_5853_length_3988_cov_2.188995_3_plen_175_part_01